MRTPAEVLDLFLQQPESGTKIDWLVESFLATSAEVDSFYLGIEHDGDPPSSYMVARVGERSHSDGDRRILRQFRTLLARMAKMGADESGAEFNPYGCEMRMRRAGTDLVIHFENTTVSQSLRIAPVASMFPERTAITQGKERNLIPTPACES